MLDVRSLLTVADAYSAALGLPETTVSYRVFGDTKKLAAMRNGADIVTGRFNAAMRWFSINWPDGAAWPVDVPRPAATSEAAE